MSNNEDLIRKVDIEKIAQEGEKIYGELKEQYDSEEKGKFLAIEIDSKDVYLGATSAEALEIARQHHTGKVFYVVKIGFEVAETMAKSLLHSS